MKKLRVNVDAQNKLFMSIDKQLQQLRKRNISYVINCHSGTVASITIKVTGKAGSVTRNLVYYYDALELCWVVLTNSYKFLLENQSELQTIAKSLVSKSTTLVNKIP